MKSNNAITIKNLSLKLGNNLVLDNLNFDINLGEILVVVGPNGAGKSSLINVLLGLQKFQVGQVIFNQEKKTEDFSYGYVSSSFSLEPNSTLTVNELLDLALINCHHSNTEKNRLIINALEKVALKKLQFKKYNSLSMGQKQRVLLARAIVHKPVVLFLDEPEIALDYLAISSLYKLLTKLAKEEKIAIVLASHNFAQSGKIADQVLGLNKKMIFYGKCDLLKKEKNILNLFKQ